MTKEELIARLEFLANGAVERKLPNSRWPQEPDPWFEIAYQLDCIMLNIERDGIDEM